MSIKIGIRRVGYIRVSNRNQNKGRQFRLMQEVDISPRDIFVDKQSGKTSTK